MSDRPVDQQARDTAANDLDTTLCVEAAAGTGKTTALIARILSILLKGRARLHEIVAITFTEKAAGELKIKLRETIEKQLVSKEDAPSAAKVERLRDALNDLERAHITTIHSFCAWLLRERPVEAKLDPQFAVADALQKELLLEEAWEQWIGAELTRDPHPLRRALLFDVGVDQIRTLARELVEQKAQLLNARWPALVPANAAAVLARLQAATPALERCLAHCVARSEPMVQRARTLLDALPRLEQATDDRKAAVLAGLELTNPKAKAQFDSPEAFREMKEIVTGLKGVLEEFRVAVDHNFLTELVQWLEGFVRHFDAVKQQKALLDFDDLLLNTRDLLRDDLVVRGQLQERFKFLLVDEFQDTDPLQIEIVFFLAERKPLAKRWEDVKLLDGKLFAVGDPKQSIYGFRRADIEMYSKARRIIETQGEALTIQQNFRSQSTILAWVNDVFTKLIRKPADGDYQPDYVELKPSPAHQTDQPTVVLLRPKQFPADATIQKSRELESAAIARHLKQQVEDGDRHWSDIALLFRSFTAMDIFGDALQHAGVPFRIIGGKDYYLRQEIQTLSSLLSCLDNPNDRLHLVAVLRSSLFGWTDDQILLVSATIGLNYLQAAAAVENDQIRQGFALLRELHEQRHAFSVAGYVQHVFARTKICEACFVRPDGAQCVANLQKALELARQFETAGLRSVRAFVRRLRETVLGGMDEEPSPANEETDDVVRLLTMHKSKGLQFPVVVLADLAGGSQDSGPKLQPDRQTGTMQARFASRRTSEFDAAGEHQDKRDEAEEIRLLYVAATRAQKQLIVPWFREKGGRLDLLRGGFNPVASALVELIEAEMLPSTERTDTAPVLVKLDGKADAEVKRLIAKRRDWQACHRELLQRSAQPLARFSPSKLKEETEVAISADILDGASRARAIELGIFIHDALEHLTLSTTEDEQLQQMQRIIRESGLSADDKQRATRMLEQALGSDLLARVRKSAQVLRELPFSMMTEEGLLEGKIDLLFREDDNWVLVDYKTDSRIDADRYRAQLEAYKQAVKHIAGVDVHETLLFFLAEEKVVRISR